MKGINYPLNYKRWEDVRFLKLIYIIKYLHTGSLRICSIYVWTFSLFNLASAVLKDGSYSAFTTDCIEKYLTCTFALFAAYRKLAFAVLLTLETVNIKKFRQDLSVLRRCSKVYKGSSQSPECHLLRSRLFWPYLCRAAANLLEFGFYNLSFRAHYLSFDSEEIESTGIFKRILRAAVIAYPYWLLAAS
jgi:hypothetical protein